MERAARGKAAGLLRLLFAGGAGEKPAQGVADARPVGRHRGAVLDGTAIEKMTVPLTMSAVCLQATARGNYQTRTARKAGQGARPGGQRPAHVDRGGIAEAALKLPDRPTILAAT